MIAPLGDTALIMRLGQQIDEPTRQLVLSAVHALESATLPGAAEVVPGMTSVVVHFDPARLDWLDDPALNPFEVMRRAVAAALDRPGAGVIAAPNQVEIPVCYGGDFGPDLDWVASHTGFSASEVIERHSRPAYRVHLIGFLPGFPYLGGLDPALASPRRDTPRTLVPAGSVGIGGAQTGIYPLESPGGWQLIGRSPVVLFDPERNQPTLLSPGDLVRFRAIDRAEYDRLQRVRA